MLMSGFLCFAKLHLFSCKIFLFRKTNGLQPFFWCLHQYFICPFFHPNTHISMHTHNMTIKVLKTWKFELSVSGLFDCFIRILLSSINKKKNKKILIQQKIQLKIKQLNFLICNFCMAHSLLYRITILDFFLLPTWKSSLNISRGSKFQTSL